MAKAFFVFLCLLIGSLHCFSQLQVRGTVYESEMGDKLDSVVVKVDGMDICSTTDTGGHYKITVPNGKAFLLFSKNGYDGLYEKVRNSYEINVVMAQLFSEATNVNVGYGTQRTTEITGAVASLGSSAARPRSYVSSTKQLKKKKHQ